MTTGDTPAALSLLQPVRACYGGALLIAPGRVIRLVTRNAPGSRALGVARVLGARHLIQAALTIAAGSSAPSVRAGAVIDAVHAASMVTLAIADRRVRRLTVADAVIATTFAAAGVSAAWPAAVRTG